MNCSSCNKELFDSDYCDGCWDWHCPDCDGNRPLIKIKKEAKTLQRKMKAVQEKLLDSHDPKERNELALEGMRLYLHDKNPGDAPPLAADEKSPLGKVVESIYELQMQEARQRPNEAYTSKDVLIEQLNRSTQTINNLQGLIRRLEKSNSELALENYELKKAINRNASRSPREL